ncbi:MAG: hypothetical protein M3O15_07920 [Acidobacteriota bacterium]|nr:hypothetical protein [Acidobacteriota bacterium]
MLATRPGTNGADWWGFFRFFDFSHGVEGISEFQVTWSSSQPSVPTVWVLTGANYQFTPLTAGNDSVYPLALAVSGNVKSLLVDSVSGVTQLWGDTETAPYSNTNVNCNTSTLITCPSNQADCGPSFNLPGCRAGDGSCAVQGSTNNNGYTLNTDYLNDTGSTLSWWEVLRYSFGPTNRVTSQPGGRFFPTGYDTGRLMPFRWNSSNGTRYLFSATDDAQICSTFSLGPYWHEYVVMSTVTWQ